MWVSNFLLFPITAESAKTVSCGLKWEGDAKFKSADASRVKFVTCMIEIYVCGCIDRQPFVLRVYIHINVYV